MELINNRGNNELSRRQNLSPDLQRKKQEILERYGDRENFLKTITPDLQKEVAKDPYACYFGDSPSLTNLNNTYGERMAQIWLIPQLFNFSEFCGAKEKLNDFQLEELAWNIATEFYYLKVDEMLLFFQRLKSSRYGKFYNSVDPLIIMDSLHKFRMERNNEIDRYEKSKPKETDPGAVDRITYEQKYKVRLNPFIKKFINNK